MGVFTSKKILRPKSKNFVVVNTGNQLAFSGLGRTGTGLLPPFARHDSDLCPICRGVSHLKIQRMLRPAQRYAGRHINMPPGMNRYIDMSSRHEPAYRCAGRQINKHSTVLLGPSVGCCSCVWSALCDVAVERLLIILFLNGRCCCWRFYCMGKQRRCAYGWRWINSRNNMQLST